MATGSTVNVAVNVTAPGLSQANKDAAQLHSSLKGAAAASQGVRVAGPVAAARQGVAAQRGESQEYGVARGTVGTGAEGRDFAKQSQGLGGLVRVYATFAANLFAVTAAFGALSRAADTTNLIKGLDQLGAASGRSLGSLAKQLSFASDGAISLRDAMQATAQASAAGMSSEAILRMGQAASKASQALGVAMPDALSRISRGITKLEPELLDELGIFVRVDRASEEYARTLGKTTSSLTDFEKRQGFANAVLEQAEKKFGNIEITANPYAKLLASMQNVAQTGLELVNKVLTPIVTILSSSPTALAAVMTGIAGILLKQAIPALGEYKKGLDATTTLVAKKAQESYLEQQHAAIDQDGIVRASTITRYKLQQDYYNKLSALENSAGQFTNSTRVKWAKLATENVLDLSDEQIKSLNRRVTTLQKTDIEESNRLKRQITDILAVQKIKRDAEAIADELQEKREAADTKFYTQEAVLRRNSIATGREVTKTHIYNMAAQAQATSGASAAYKKLFSDISASKKGIDIPTGELDAAGKAATRLGPATTTLARGIMTLSGAIRIAALSVGTLVASFLPWLELIGLAVVAIIALVSWMGNTKKEAEETSKAMDTLTNAIDSSTKTIDLINKKPLLEQISVESIQAKATALNELVTATKTAVDKSNAELSKMGAASTFKNFVAKLWGGDVQSELNEKVSESVVSAFKLLNQGPSAEAARASVSKILGVSIENTEELEFALSKMGDKGKSAIQSLIPMLQKLGQESAVSAAKGVELKDSYTQTNKVFDEFALSLKAADSYSKLGTGMIDGAAKLKIALDDPTTALNAMLTVATNVNALRLFPEAAAKSIIVTTDRLKEYQVEQANANAMIVKFDSEIQNLSKNIYTNINQISGNITDKEKQRILEVEQAANASILRQISDLGKKRSAQIDIIANVQAKTSELKQVFEAAVLSQFKQGAEIVSAKLARDFAEAAGILKTGLAGMLGDTKAGIMLRAQYEKESLNVQNQAINTQMNLAAITEKLIVEMELARIQTEKRLAKESKSDFGLTYDKLLQDEKKALLRKEDLSSKKMPTFRSVSRQMGSGSIPIDQDRLNFLQAQEAGLAAKAKNANQARLIDIKALVDLEKKSYDQDKKIIEGKIKGLELEQASFDLLSSISGITTEESIKQKQSIADRKQQYEIDSELVDKSAELAGLKRITNAFIKAGYYQSAIEADKEVQRVEKERKDLVDRRSQEQGIQTSQKNASERLKVALEEQQRAQEFAYRILEQIQETEQTRLDTASSTLDLQKELGLITDKEYLAKKSVLDIDKQSLDVQKKIDELNKAKEQKISGLEGTVAQLQLLPPTAARNKEIERTQGLIAQENALVDTQISRLLTALGINNSIVTSKTAEAIKQEEINKAIEKSAEKMKLVEDFANNLTTAFGDLGTAIGGMSAAIIAMAEQDKSYLKEKLDLEAKIKDVKASPQSVAENQEKLTKLEKKQVQDQLSGYGKLAAAGKKLFGEKTAAYKILDGLEKASAAYRAYIQFKDLAMELKSFAIRVGLMQAEVGVTATTSAEKAAAKTPNIIAEIWSSVPPWLAVGITAAVLASIGASGGSPSVDMTGRTSADRQAAQGTGTVTGDSTAKSESIKNSLDILNATTVEGLSYSNRMVDLLKSINDGISGVAQGVYGAVGITSGTGFGTKEGESGFNILGGLFGSSTSKQITDSGLAIKGTFADFVNGSKNFVQAYEDVLTTSTSSFLWFSSTSQSLNQQLRELDPKVAKSISSVFKNAADAFIEAGKGLEMTEKSVMDQLATIDLSQLVSLRGLKGKELEEALASTFSAMLDNAAGVVFKQLEEFNKFGEGMLQTAVRVVDGLSKVNLAMESIGKSTVGKGLSGIRISEELINAAGGLSDFLDKTKSFGDKFLTEAERLKPKQEAINKELNSLGYASNMTRQQFKDLILGFKVTDKASAITYNKLLDLADGIDEVSSAAEEATKAAKALKDSKLDQQIKILELLGKTEEALALTRAKELETLDDALKPGQKYIYALEDEIALRNKLVTAYNDQKAAINSTISSLKQSIKTLGDYRTSLTTGSSTTLDPTQIYQQTKSTKEALESLIKSTPVTEAEKAAQAEAIAKYPAASEAFLNASKTLFASSEQYQKDFKSVTDFIDSSVAILEGQKTEAEKQLTVLTDSYTELKIISEQTKTTAELMAEYLLAVTATGKAKDAYTGGIGGGGQYTVGPVIIPGFASGGLGSGISVVGEQGPELVDFKTPGRVYSNRASNDLLNNQELVNEIKNLHREIAQLRRDQKEQTGHLIKANYDANQLAAEQVAAATEEAAATSAWLARSIPKIA